MAQWKVIKRNKYLCDLDQYKPIHITPELKPDPREMVVEDLNIAPEWEYDHEHIINTDFQFGAVIDRPQNRRHEEYEAKYNKSSFYTPKYRKEEICRKFTSNPHGNLSISQLRNINIRQRNACYVQGLPIHIATEHMLCQDIWFGKFGKIIRIIFPQKKQDKLLSSQTASITFADDTSALNAINYCMNNNFMFDNPNRKIKAIYGMQQYCLSFLQNIQCIDTSCGLRHSWCRTEDIITENDVKQFQSIPYGLQTQTTSSFSSLRIRKKFHFGKRIREIEQKRVQIWNDEIKKMFDETQANFSTKRTLKGNVMMKHRHNKNKRAAKRRKLYGHSRTTK